MTPYQKRTLSTLAQRMAGEMLVRNLSQRTIDAYRDGFHHPGWRYAAAPLR